MLTEFPDQLPTLFDPHEVASFFRVKRRTVYSWLDSGRLPALRVNGRLRFDRASLTQLLQPNADAPGATQ
jgi:excisionase family DNA binding protein